MPQRETFSSSQLSRQGDSNISEEDFFLRVSPPIQGTRLQVDFFGPPLILLETMSIEESKQRVYPLPKKSSLLSSSRKVR